MGTNNGTGRSTGPAIDIRDAMARLDARQKHREQEGVVATKREEVIQAAQQLQVTVGQVLDEVLAREGDYNADDVANGIVRLHMLAQTYQMSVQDLTAGLRYLTERWSDGQYKPQVKVVAQD